MADLTSDAIASNFNKFSISQSDAGAEIVVSATKTGGFLDADILAIYRQLTVAGGSGTGTDIDGPDAFTVAAFGTATGTFRKNPTAGDDLGKFQTTADGGANWTIPTVVYFRIQGSGGTPNLTTVDASTYRDGDTNDITLAAVAHFKPAL
jgi:hypothetical protein